MNTKTEPPVMLTEKSLTAKFRKFTSLPIRSKILTKSKCSNLTAVSPVRANGKAILSDVLMPVVVVALMPVVTLWVGMPILTAIVRIAIRLFLTGIAVKTAKPK